MKILAFGIVKDIFKDSAIDVEIKDEITIAEFKTFLEKKYPGLDQLGSYMIAINSEYVSNNKIIHKEDEVAIIPPVSGG